FEDLNSVIQNTTEVFKNSMLSINSTIKNMNNTVLKYNEEIKGIESIKPNSESILGKRQNSSSNYDELAFLFNNLNKDVIIRKINENTLENESKLSLASNIKINFNEVFDLTRESLYECKEITESGTYGFKEFEKVNRNSNNNVQQRELKNKELHNKIE
ncbi:2629_t:CDS:2, partial [Scutellospora calospora]